MVSTRRAGCRGRALVLDEMLWAGERGAMRAGRTDLYTGEVAICGGDPDVFEAGHQDRDRRLSEDTKKLLEKEILYGAVVDGECMTKGRQRISRPTGPRAVTASRPGNVVTTAAHIVNKHAVVRI